MDNQEGDNEDDAMRAAAAERIGGAAFSMAWHADGTAYTDDDYERAGMKPPSSDEREWQNLPLEEQLARIGRWANTGAEDETDEGLSHAKG